jgi:hypothetical protein
MTDSPKTVRMTGSQVTEWNHSAFGIFTPRDDGSFAIPKAAVPDALKAGLVVAELSQGKKLVLIRDAIADLDESDIRSALLAEYTRLQVASWEARQAAKAAA